MGALLQQQPGAVFPFGMPVLEVVVPAVSDEMAAPDGLDLADRAVGDQPVHYLDDVHVAHVVPDVEPGPGLVGGLQHGVGVRDGNRQRFLQKDRDARTQQIDGDGRVRIVGRQHEGGVDPMLYQFTVGAHDLDTSTDAGHPGCSVRVRLGGHHDTSIVVSHVAGESGPGPGADNADP